MFNAPGASRYTYQDLGICVIVCDGLSSEVTGISYDQAAQLIEQPNDGERDFLFAPWARQARERRSS